MANDAIVELKGILANLGVFHRASPEIERFPQIPGPTYFRIWKPHLIREGVVSQFRQLSFGCVAKQTVDVCHCRHTGSSSMRRRTPNWAIPRCGHLMFYRSLFTRFG